MSEDRRQVNMAQEILGTPQPADTFKQGWNFEVYIWPCRHSLLKPQHCGIVTSNTEFTVGFSAKSILPFLAICSTDSVLNQSNSISSRWEINKAVVSVPKTINSETPPVKDKRNLTWPTTVTGGVTRARDWSMAA